MHPLGGFPDRPRLWRQLTGSNDTRPPLLSALARWRRVEETRVQALTFSGSSIASGPYGASQQFSNFNAGQIAGIAAGTAAGQFNQILQQQTPKQSTVNLAADVDVGIMFLAPVEDTK